MKRLRNGSIALLVLAMFGVPQAQAADPSPAWAIQSIAAPTNFKPGDESGTDSYLVYLTNSGGATTDRSPITIVDTLPADLEVAKVQLFPPRENGADIGKPPACETTMSGEVSTVSCEVTEALRPSAEPAKLYPGDQLCLQITVKTPSSVSGALVNRVEVAGGGAPKAAASETENLASEEDAHAGFEEFHARATDAAGEAADAADSHPYEYVTSFAVDTVPTQPGSSNILAPAEGDLKEIEVTLPPGLVGNPTAVERCTAQQFITTHGTKDSTNPNECPAGSAVGLVAVQQFEGERFNAAKVPLYSLVPPKGMPAQFGFEIFTLPTYINTKVRSDGDYGVTAYLHNVTQAKRVTAAQVTIWGTPWDESHDTLRGECSLVGGRSSCPAEGTPRPFLRLPSFCANPLSTTMSFETWAQPPAFASAADTAAAPTECEKPDFSPTIEAKPTTNVADAPSGLHVDVHLPQKANEDPEGLGEADLRDAKVTLPEGLVANPSSANGREACSPSEIGLTTPVGQPDAHFDLEAPACPDASKLGTVEVESPLVDHPLKGAVYLALPHENPFDSLLAIYIAVEDPQTGVVIKLAGHAEPDPQTGQLTTTFKDNPQLPFEDFKLDFFEGARAPLRTPAFCGTHTTNTEMTPWTAPAGSSAFPSDSFQIAQSPSGGSCPSSPSGEPNAPRFEAGTVTPVAGAYSPLIVNLSRQDGSQELSGLTLTPPPGLLARLAGIPYCPEAALSAAASKSGRSEEQSPSCPAASQVGTVEVAAGAGPAPYHASGKAYLAGPYKGAPLSLAIVTPAVAGPFDLGTVVVRSALRVNPATAQVTAVSDPIPHILEGIPLDVRSVAVKLDHPGWGLNPTSCAPFSFTGSLLSTQGSSAPLLNPFQVGGCADLGLKPKLSLNLKGKTKRGNFPALHAVYRPRPGDANLKGLALRFPHSEFIEQGHFRTICTRVQYAAGNGGGEQCPPGSIYGHIKAVTPLLDQPLEGPVYLRSSNHNLPDVVFALKGQIDAEAAVRIDSQKGGLRASIEGAPDAPLSEVVLDMQGGAKGLFVNSRDICASTNRASALFSAHNGRTASGKPVLKAKCKGVSRKGAKRGQRKR